MVSKLTKRIPATPETMERLRELGKMGETYDKFINRALDVYEGAVKNAVR